MEADTRPIYGSLQYPHMDFYLGKNPYMDISKVISANLTDWMSTTPSLDTFKKIALKSGVGFGTVQRTKNGDGNITVEKLTAIARAFGRHPAELMIQPESIDEAADIREYRRAVFDEAQRFKVSEPEPAALYSFPSLLVAELVAIAEKLNDAGLNRLIGHAQQLATTHPKSTKGNAAQ